MKKICFKHDYYWTGEFVGTAGACEKRNKGTVKKMS